LKVGIIGAGAVGAACAKSMMLRGSCIEIVIVEREHEEGDSRSVRKEIEMAQRKARGLANDLIHGSSLCPYNIIRAGSYDDLENANVVAITAGINEITGKAIDPKVAAGRLLLLPDNAKLYKKIIPRITGIAPNAVILVVTDPPDPLADIARLISPPGTNILSTGTYLDSLRFRVQLAARFDCHPGSIDAMVLGEHGTSQVYVWSTARIGGQSILKEAKTRGWNVSKLKKEIQNAVKYANIDIIKGTGASQHGIGVVTARIVEAILRDDGLVAPIGSYHKRPYDATYSLPTIIGCDGVRSVIDVQLSDSEHEALASSAAIIRSACESEL
jgi:L-lactate dehydrogenase